MITQPCILLAIQIVAWCAWSHLPLAEPLSRQRELRSLGYAPSAGNSAIWPVAGETARRTWELEP